MLTTFLLINKNDVISPILTTTQLYGTWLEDVFGEYIAKQELYMRSVKKNGDSVLEWHPGTRIGKWFDSNKTSKNCWYVYKSSPVLERLEHYKLAKVKDAVSKVPNGVIDETAIRLYTVDQIELYIRSCIDPSFSIAKYIEESKQIKVKNTEMLDIVIPRPVKKKTLF